MRNKTIKSRLIALGFLLCGIALFLSPACDSSPQAQGADSDDKQKTAQVNWYSYQQGLQKAKNQEKKVYLYFFSDNCHFCRVMDKKTFTSESVIAKLNKHFLPVRVNMGEKRELAKDYNIKGVPCSWFLKQSGEKIGGRPGYLKPEQFKKLLDYIIKEKYNQ